MRYGDASAVCICLLMIFLFSGCPPTVSPIPEYTVHYDFNDSTSQGWDKCWFSSGTTYLQDFGDGSIRFTIGFTTATPPGGIDIAVTATEFDITGRDLVFRMKIPQVFITDYELRFFITDGTNRSDKIISLIDVFADQWAILRIDSIDSTIFSGVDLTKISGIGMEINRKNGPLVSFTVELDDVYVSWD